jgi:hypothetical protein
MGANGAKQRGISNESDSTHFEFGVYLDVQDDLSRDRRVVAGGEGSFGLLRIGLGLQMGLSHDFF